MDSAWTEDGSVLQCQSEGNGSEGIFAVGASLQPRRATPNNSRCLAIKKNTIKSFVGFITTLFRLFTALVSFDKSKHTFGDFCSRCAGLTSYVVIIYVDVFAISNNTFYMGMFRNYRFYFNVFNKEISST